MAELIHLAQSFMNAKDAVIAKKKKNICTIQSKVLVQRKHRREKKEIEMAGRQDHPQDNIPTTLPCRPSVDANQG